MSDLRVCAVIPTCNHADALDAILTRLEQTLPRIIVVDDGSRPEMAERIAAICARHAVAERHRLEVNQGKGAAVLEGLRRAKDLGFTHAVQVDADGQHDLDGLAALLAAAKADPLAIVTGEPQFDASMPASRRFWRPFTNFWVRVNAVCPRMPDAMCGFRVYPVARTIALLTQAVRGRRMEFESEILVKAHWRGISVAGVPVRVIYPPGNSSNFDMLHDNVRLSLMQTRLFFGMLLRLPVLLLRMSPARATATDDATRWPDMKERGAYWGLRILAAVYCTIGRTACIAVMSPVVLYFFATGREQRRASQDYLSRLWARGMLPARPTLWTSYGHFMAFGAALVDRLGAWTGRIDAAQIDGIGSGLLQEVEDSGAGVFVLTAHIGSPEVIRAIAMLGRRVRVNVLMHVEQARFFNRLIAHFAPNSPMTAIPVSTVGVDTAIFLADAIARGEWVVMAADRVPVREDGRTVAASFLGADADFPQGPYILAALLKAPAYVLFCVRGAQGFEARFTKFADRIVLPRAAREPAIARYAQDFAAAMESQLSRTPLQWFNFYGFWPKTQTAAAQTADARRAAE